ncbi:MAG: CRP-like cAMP-binding protein [Kiritimatiellia bacterium]|jgi:CRP-like cAMP-binding protein
MKFASTPAWLEGISGVEVEQMLAGMVERRFASGDVLFLRGIPADQAGLIISGCVSTSIGREGHEHRLGRSWPGEVIGETAIYHPSAPRSATTTALEDTVVLEWNRELLENQRSNPAIRSLERMLIGEIAGRLRASHLTIEQVWREADDPTDLAAPMDPVDMDAATPQTGVAHLAEYCHHLLDMYDVVGATPEHAMDILTRADTRRQWTNGEVLCTESERGEELFLLLAGSVDVLKLDQEGQQRFLTRVYAPSLLGHMCLVDDSPRSATCRSNGAVIATIDRVSYDALIDSADPAGVLFRRLILGSMTRQLGDAGNQIERSLRHAEPSENLRGTIGSFFGWKPRLMSEVCDPRGLSPSERERLLDEIEPLARICFEGDGKMNFAVWFSEEAPGLQELMLLRDASGRAVGFNYVSVFEVPVDGQLVGVFRSAATILPEHRGQGSTFAHALTMAVRYKVRHPDRRTVVMLRMLGPTAYLVMKRYAREIWPRRDAPTPPAVLAQMRLFADAFGFELSEQTPYVSPSDMRPRHSADEVKAWERSTNPDLQYFLQVNPDYREGQCLVGLVPLTVGNLTTGAWRQLRRQLRRPGTR